MARHFYRCGLKYEVVIVIVITVTAQRPLSTVRQQTRLGGTIPTQGISYVTQ